MIISFHVSDRLHNYIRLCAISLCTLSRYVLVSLQQRRGRKSHGSNTLNGQQSNLGTCSASLISASTSDSPPSAHTQAVPTTTLSSTSSSASSTADEQNSSIISRSHSPHVSTSAQPSFPSSTTRPHLSSLSTLVSFTSSSTAPYTEQMTSPYSLNLSRCGIGSGRNTGSGNVKLDFMSQLQHLLASAACISNHTHTHTHNDVSLSLKRPTLPYDPQLIQRSDQQLIETIPGDAHQQRRGSKARETPNIGLIGLCMASFSVSTSATYTYYLFSSATSRGTAVSLLSTSTIRTFSFNLFFLITFIVSATLSPSLWTHMVTIIISVFTTTPKTSNHIRLLRRRYRLCSSTNLTITMTTNINRVCYPHNSL